MAIIYTIKSFQILINTHSNRNTDVTEKYTKSKNRDDDTKCFTHLMSNIFILMNVLMDRFAY